MQKTKALNKLSNAQQRCVSATALSSQPFYFFLLASWRPGPGALETRRGVLEAGLGVLGAGPGVLEARLGVLEARLGVLEARLGVVGRPGSTSWCTPMRFYKVFGVKTGPMGSKAKKYYFSTGISMDFVLPGHTLSLIHI